MLEFNFKISLPASRRLPLSGHLLPRARFAPVLPVPQEFRYLASIAVKGGKVFALFVRCPARVGTCWGCTAHA